MEPEGRIKYGSIIGLIILNVMSSFWFLYFEKQYNYAITKPNNYFAQITAISAGLFHSKTSKGKQSLIRRVRNYMTTKNELYD